MYTLYDVIRQLKIAGFYLRDVEDVDTQVLKSDLTDLIVLAQSLIPQEAE